LKTDLDSVSAWKGSEFRRTLTPGMMPKNGKPQAVCAERSTAKANIPQIGNLTAPASADASERGRAGLFGLQWIEPEPSTHKAGYAGRRPLAPVNVGWANLNPRG
jgi:hypothetical protein